MAEKAVPSLKLGEEEKEERGKSKLAKRSFGGCKKVCWRLLFFFVSFFFTTLEETSTLSASIKRKVEAWNLIWPKKAVALIAN